MVTSVKVAEVSSAAIAFVYSVAVVSLTHGAFKTALNKGRTLHDKVLVMLPAIVTLLCFINLVTLVQAPVIADMADILRDVAVVVFVYCFVTHMHHLAGGSAAVAELLGERKASIYFYMLYQFFLTNVLIYALNFKGTVTGLRGFGQFFRLLLLTLAIFTVRYTCKFLQERGRFPPDAQISNKMYIFYVFVGLELPLRVLTGFAALELANDAAIFTPTQRGQRITSFVYSLSMLPMILVMKREFSHHASTLLDEPLLDGGDTKSEMATRSDLTIGSAARK